MNPLVACLSVLYPLLFFENVCVCVCVCMCVCDHVTLHLKGGGSRRSAKDINAYTEQESVAYQLD